VNPTAEGLPTGSEAEELNAWEDALDFQLRQSGGLVYVGRVTCNGERELLYYIENQESCVQALSRLSALPSMRAFAFTCERDETWGKADFWLKRQ
jgi:Family of unknown function (DUF695)